MLKSLLVGILAGVTVFVLIVVLSLGLAVITVEQLASAAHTSSGGLGSVSGGVSEAAFGAALVACVATTWWNLRRTKRAV